MAGNAEFVRQVDRAAIAARAPDERLTQSLLDVETGAAHCTVTHIVTPPGSGSPEGLHVHDADQIFYVLAGTMSIEVAGEVTLVGPGGLIVFPAGTPHRNWNEGRDATEHLSIYAPIPPADRPRARHVEASDRTPVAPHQTEGDAR